MKRYIMLVILVIPALSWATEGVVVLGEGFSLMIKAPQGWVPDTKVDAGSGISAVLYPEGSSWQDAASVMYVRTKKTRESLDSLVKNDVAEFRADCPGIQIQTEKSPVKANYPLQMKRFTCTSGAAPNSELVAYLDVGKQIIVIWVVSSRTEAQLNSTRPAFEQVLKNFKMWDVVFDRKARDKIHDSGDEELKIIP